MKNFLNPKGHHNCISGSKVMTILLKYWSLPIGVAASGRFCATGLFFILLSLIKSYKTFARSIRFCLGVEFYQRGYNFVWAKSFKKKLRLNLLTSYKSFCLVMLNVRLLTGSNLVGFEPIFLRISLFIPAIFSD